MAYENLFNFAREAEAILIVNGGENSLDKTFRYITQSKGGLFEGSFIVATSKNATIYTSVLEEETARSTGLDVQIFHSRKEYEEMMKNALQNVNTVGLNYSSLSLESYKNLLRIIPDKEFVDVSVSILESRKIKDKREINNLKEAAKIASESIEKVYDALKEGMTEKEVAALVVYEMMKNGADGPSFSTIVAFGENSSQPHYSPGERKLKKGDVVLIDYGALYNGYCSDVTRTASFGKANSEVAEVYSIVYRAQQESMKIIKENVNGKEVDLKARNVIDSTKYKDTFIHSLGHGIGLDVHDHSALSPNLDFPLKENMVVTDEPGIYMPGKFGVRIEDDVIVKKDGFELISGGASKEIREV
ncbi:M24 family metallopeptidase [Cuniculiplasma sp. SKW4]|uniref:M24 family metallopeptidase n=1 Tax=Cuniculiplasma sp. SKW4 TaxID=3400171 RepID=UPI003FD01FDF